MVIAIASSPQAFKRIHKPPLQGAPKPSLPKQAEPKQLKWHAVANAEPNSKATPEWNNQNAKPNQNGKPTSRLNVVAKAMLRQQAKAVLARQSVNYRSTTH
ncbi:MAG: hypothetical protein P3M73_00230 [Candidatus Hodgkinia cicadicola]|nr:MAG: hypothetical protein P3M73_00230 [Candidatus Hodgkinia cicadicola]